MKIHRKNKRIDATTETQKMANLLSLRLSKGHHLSPRNRTAQKANNKVDMQTISSKFKLTVFKIQKPWKRKAGLKYALSTASITDTKNYSLPG
jgi:hypothetical protein